MCPIQPALLFAGWRESTTNRTDSQLQQIFVIPNVTKKITQRNILKQFFWAAKSYVYGIPLHLRITPWAWWLLNMDFSQGSVATRLRRGGISKYYFIENLLLNITIEGFWKSVNIWQSCGQDHGVLFFLTHSVDINFLLYTVTVFEHVLLAVVYLRHEVDISRYIDRQRTVFIVGGPAVRKGRNDLSKQRIFRVFLHQKATRRSDASVVCLTGQRECRTFAPLRICPIPNLTIA